jgi:Domain of unknown function (DUF4126)
MQPLFTAYSLSGAAGVRSSWVMFVVACAVHLGYLSPPPSLEWLGSWWLILLAGTASLIDFAGDKIPVLDHGLHGIHFILAPLVGGLSAASGYHGDPVLSVILGVAGGANALFLHTTKAGLRAASSVTTAGLANPLISLAEDALALFFIIIAILAPLFTAVAMLLATIWLVRKVKRLASRRRGTLVA